jgi:hypothetical protein
MQFVPSQGIIEIANGKETTHRRVRPAGRAHPFLEGRDIFSEKSGTLSHTQVIRLTHYRGNP